MWRRKGEGESESTKEDKENVKLRAVKKDVKIEGEEKERLSAQSKVSKIMVLCPYESKRVTGCRNEASRRSH